MATLEDFDKIASLLEMATNMNFSLGFSGETGQLELLAPSFNASMPRTVVTCTDSADKIMNKIWDDRNTPIILAESGRSRIILSIAVVDGAKNLKVEYQSREAGNTCIYNTVEESAMNTRLKVFMKTKRYQKVMQLVEAFNQAKHEYTPSPYLRKA